MPSAFRKNETITEFWDGRKLFVVSVSIKVDFLSSQKSLAASWQVLASSQNNFLSVHEYDNLMKIGLAGLSNRGS